MSIDKEIGLFEHEINPTGPPAPAPGTHHGAERTCAAKGACPLIGPTLHAFIVFRRYGSALAAHGSKSELPEVEQAATDDREQTFS